MISCHGKICYVFLSLGGSGAVSSVRKEKIMTAAAKILGKLFAKMECLRQQLSFRAMVWNQNQEYQISPFSSNDIQVAVNRGIPTASQFQTDQNE